MGVNELWSILEPVRESVPLYHLTGKTLAVDLSLWVCEAQFVKEMAGRVAKPHLRNLFFRVSSLTHMGIKLIFVMEGEAPKMKAETMCQRNQLRFGHSKKTVPRTTNTGRSRFKAVLKECAEMLDCLGIPRVTAAGEAEAMCAYLDSLGLVDGCITNDGDSFLYGAQTVYRNFNMNSKDPQVECYRMSKIEPELGLTRETLVGLAILLGCDYLPKGIPGVGKEQAVKLIKTLKGQTLLQKFRQWESEGRDMQNPAVKKVTHCPLCHHPGSAKTHERSGCALCGSRRFCQPQDYDYSCPCDWHQTEQARHANSAEANVKRKTLASEGFPFKEIINEFLVSKDRPIQNVTRRKPNMLLMQNFALDKMEWPKSYTSEKVLVLITYAEMMNRKCGRENTTQIQPLRIFKSRVRNGIASFEVIWKKPDHYVYAGDQSPGRSDTVRTVEEEALFRAAYPELAQRFLEEQEEARESKLKQKKRSKKKDKDKEPNAGLDDVSDMFSQMSIHASSAGPAEAPAGDVVSAAHRENAPDPAACPQSPDQQREVSGKHDLADPWGICTEEAEPGPSPVSSGNLPAAAACSPSVAAAIEELHLSDIDWDGASFSSARSPQPQAERPSLLPATTAAVLTPVRGTGRAAEERGGVTEAGGLAGLKLSPERALDSRATANLCQIPLRERVLARNAIMCSAALTDVETARPSRRTDPPECTAFSPGHPGASSKDGGVGTHLGPQQFPLKKTSTGDSKNAGGIQRSERPAGTAGKARKAAGSGIAGPPPFVKMGRSRSEQSVGAGRGGRARATKKSVCASVPSSSENSDAENRPAREQRRTVRPKARKHCPQLLHHGHRPAQEAGLPAAAGAGSGTAGCQPQALRSDQGQSGCAPVTERNWESVDDGEVFIESPVFSQKVNMTEGDDSVISVDSPLPLAERLKLKFKLRDEN